MTPPLGSAAPTVVPPTSTAALVPVKAQTPAGASEAADSEGASDGTGQMVAGGIIGSVGIVGIVLGAIFGAQAKSKESEADSHCNPDNLNQCTQDGLDLLDEGKTAATISNVGFIAGGVLLAGGIVIMLTAPSSGGAPTAAAPAARLELVPWLGAGLGGLGMRGAF